MHNSDENDRPHLYHLSQQSRGISRETEWKAASLSLGLALVDLRSKPPSHEINLQNNKQTNHSLEHPPNIIRNTIQLTWNNETAMKIAVSTTEP